MPDGPGPPSPSASLHPAALAEGHAPPAPELFRALFHAATDAMAISRMSDGVILDVNDAACVLAGEGRAALVGRTAVSLALWPDEARRQRFLAELQESGRATAWTPIRAGGQLRDARIRSELVDVDGERFVVTTVTDLTAQLDTARRMSAIVESIADAFMTIDADWRITYANSHAEPLLRRPVTLGMPLPEALPEASGEAWRHAFSHAIESAQPVSFDAAVRGRSYSVRAFPLAGGLSFYARDVTDIVEAERARRATERQFRAVLDNVALIAVMLDTEGRIDYVNDCLCQLTGWTPDDLVGRDAFGTLVPEVRADVRDMLARGIASGMVEGRYENPIRTRDGGARLVAWSNTVRRAADGSVVGITSIGEDITDRVRAEEQLEARARQAEALAELGRRGLPGDDFDGFLVAAAELVVEGLCAERAEIVERRAGALVPRASAGAAPSEPRGAELWAPIGAEGSGWGAVVVSAGDGHAFGETETHFLAAVANVVAAAADRRAAEEALRTSEDRRRRVFAEMLRSAEEERAAVAADLHDDTVQVITATLFSLDRVTAAVAAGDGARAAAASQKARDTLAAAVERTRRLMFELRPPLLEAHGLEPAIRDLAQAAAREAGFATEVRLAVGRYEQPMEALVYRTVQEAVANVRKHAGATNLAVELAEVDGRLQGAVRDDGRGFDIERALDRRVMRMHLGLASMMERVRLAGGTIEVDSADGRGTAVRFAIPIGA